jgi:metal-responsive CopG/Arc/MetJ family transcriptional regulator
MVYNIVEVITMLNQYRESTVKYTAILPQDCVEELRFMAERKAIPSVNQGIRTAVEDFVTAYKRQEYQYAMKEAANDKGFMERTMDMQQAFAVVDAEDGEW